MEKQWYVHKDGQQKGPYSIDQLRQEYHSGLISPSDMVWTDGMGQWIQAGQLRLLAAAPAAPSYAHAQGPAAPPAGYGYQQPGYGHYAAPAAPPKGKGGLIALIVILIAILGLGGFLVWHLFFNSENGIEPLFSTGGDNGSTDLSYYGNWAGTLDGDQVYFKFEQNGTVTIAAPEYLEYIVTEYQAFAGDNDYIIQIYDEFWEEWEEVMIVEPISRDSLRVTDTWSGDRYDFRRISDQEFANILSGLTRVEF